MSLIELPATTATGIENSAIIVDTNVFTQTNGLNIDATATGISISAPPLVWGASTTPVITITPEPPAPSVEALDTTDEPSQTGASANSISIGTVVGSCVGAFLGAALLIVLGLFFYKRYSRSLKQRSHTRDLPRTPYRDTRAAEEGRRRSGPWNRLEEDDGAYQDKWEGMNQPKPPPPPTIPNSALLVPPLEKMDMFNKSPSSDISHQSHTPDESTAFEMRGSTQSFRHNDDIPSMPEPRHILGRDMQHRLGSIDSGAGPVSWADSTTSFLGASRLEGGAISPSLAVAIPTPAATRVQTHHWESAEVVNFPEAQSADIVDPDERYTRTGTANPFLAGSHDYVVSSPSKHQARSQSQASSRSRSNSNATITQYQSPPEVPRFPEALSPNTPTDKANERIVSIDPFRDPMPLPTFLGHQASGSASSAADNERAIRQLVAAAGMDLDEDEVQRRLKALSMQPSVYSMSADSMYTDGEPEFAEDDLRNFPPPPSTGGTSLNVAGHR